MKKDYKEGNVKIYQCHVCCHSHVGGLPVGVVAGLPIDAAAALMGEAGDVGLGEAEPVRTGRKLVVVFENKDKGFARVATGWDMNDSERRYYLRQREH